MLPAIVTLRKMKQISDYLRCSSQQEQAEEACQRISVEALSTTNANWSKLKEVADDDENFMQFEMKSSYGIENIVGKGEITCYKQCLLYPQCFLTYKITVNKTRFLARLGTRPSLQNIEPLVFGTGPNSKDVIEFYGEEGTGKSQMILHLMANCILSEDWNGVKIGGHGAGVIVIDTDFKFPILRLVHVMEKKIIDKVGGHNTKSEEVEGYISECLKRLQVVQCMCSSQLLLTIHSLEKLICDDLSIAAIFIDTVSEFYFVDRSNHGNTKSQQEVNMRRITAILNHLADSYKLTIFAVKSAVYKSKDGLDSTDVMKKDLEEEHSEFLCRPWHSFITHRLIFKFVSGTNSDVPNVFVIGGDCVGGNTKFQVSETGIKFI